MSPEIYEVVSQGARYWFVFLMGVIVWRSYRWLAKDRRQRKKRLRLLPDAGFIGELVVQTGNEELPPGTVLPVSREGLLGFSRGCDLCVPISGIARRHLWFRYEDGLGLRVRPAGTGKFQVDGLAWESRKQGLLMLHGSRLALGEAVLRLRMFAGFETTARAFVAETARDMEDLEEDASSPAAQPAPAFTPEQLALWQAQQQYWAMAAQTMATQAAVQAVQAVSRRPYVPAGPAPAQDADWGEAWDEDAPEDSEESMADYGEALPAYGDSPRSLASGAAAQAAYQRTASPAASNPPVFYPPVLEEEDEAWPYAPYPQSDAVFENHGYTYPELVEEVLQEDDLTDAAAPPKSLYLEPDEAEKAKKLLWDKYLGGGPKR